MKIYYNNNKYYNIKNVFYIKLVIFTNIYFKLNIITLEYNLIFFIILFREIFLFYYLYINNKSYNFNIILNTIRFNFKIKKRKNRVFN